MSIIFHTDYTDSTSNFNLEDLLLMHREYSIHIPIFNYDIHILYRIHIIYVI